MNYYGYDFIRESDITHHGILGQKWGVRRFQNKDGTRTAAGKSRYKRGKEYLDERSKIYSKEHTRLDTKNAAKISAMQDEAFKIAKKYGLDMDDGGGGNYDKYTEKELRAAGKKYLDIWEDIERLTDEAETKGFEFANNEIKRKYGEEALSDIEHYNKVNKAVAVTVIESLLLVSLWAVIKN